MSPPLPLPQTVVMSPCAACKILRRRCVDKCVLAPYFPPTEPLKFAAVHRIFGVGNVVKFLKELPENQREDTVSSLVYEANARLRDPVYGCSAAIFQLQNQITELHALLAMTKAEVNTMQLEYATLLDLFCTEASQLQGKEYSISSQQ